MILYILLTISLLINFKLWRKLKSLRSFKDYQIYEIKRLQRTNSELYIFIKDNYKQELVEHHRDKYNRYKIKEKQNFYKQMADKLGISKEDLNNTLKKTKGLHLTVIDGGKK